jgi:hypothetical protein
MNVEILGGALMILVGIPILIYGIKEESSAMGGLKYRKLTVGGGAIFFGLIMLLKSC